MCGYRSDLVDIFSLMPGADEGEINIVYPSERIWTGDIVVPNGVHDGSIGPDERATAVEG